MDPRIEVFGGKVDFERVSVRAAVSLDIRKGANVSWGKGEIAYATFTLADGAVVNISEIRLAPPSSGTPQLDIHDS
ncbi:MAG: hypothetical protein ACLGIK_08465, partial [Gemmatimonadota bacterium]